jgi:light-regulated signal transduction histidine kinase (bacteriophytochrome)
VNYKDLPPVYIDRPRLREIFDILIENCLHYAKKEGLIIHITGHSEGDRVIFCVADNGVGIKAEYHKRVLLVFERLQANENQESTGIGLAVVRRIIEHCNGSIYLKETEGGGLSVIFDLPKTLSTHQSLNAPST